MATYHLSQKFISRSSGRSAVQSAAYISGKKLYEERRSISIDYTKRKDDVIFVSTLAPEKSKYKDINVWNAVENFEDEYAKNHYKTEETITNYTECAQTASTIVLALPNELSIENNKELLEEFINTRFTNRGLISTYAIHKNEGNLHAHIQTTRRAIDEKTGEFLERKYREICTKSALIETRKLWADLANEYLEKEGVLERITEKSFADLDIDLLPTKHRGWYGDALGNNSRIVIENKDNEQINAEKIIDDPNIIIDLLNSQKALFTQRDILKELGKRLCNENQISAVFEKILEDAEYVGESVKGECLYTGKKYRELESNTLTKFDKLIASKLEENIKNKEDIREYILRENGEYGYLSKEQKKATIGLTENDQIGVLIGRAGSGKTSTMRAIAEIYKKGGHRVIGMSLSAAASENLGIDANIESMTIAKWTHSWKSYEIAKEKFLSFNEIIDNGILKQIDWYNDLKKYGQYQLKKGDVIIVDEAGMVGTKNWNEILRFVEEFGAKIIAVGDNNQFEAIASGDCFRMFTEIVKNKNQLFELNEIRRQKQDWMKKASIEFSKLNTIEGLTRYENHGNIKEFENTDNVINNAALSYIEKEKYGTTAVLCYKRNTCNNINLEIRKIKKTVGTISSETLATVNGKEFAKNDRIIFLQNDNNLNIKNGMTGIILGGTGNLLKIQINDNREIEIDTKKYDKLDYGYAITLHKSQGKTYDNVTIVADNLMDAKATYVAMTRHKENVEMLYSKDEFSSFKYLVNELSKIKQKDLIADYQNMKNENKTRVFEYQDIVIETAKTLKEINQGNGNWKEYREIKNHSILLGKEIYKNYENHKLYLDQIGITKEKLEIRIGLKNRPLSSVEINARDRVKLYAKTSEETRYLFKTMRKETFDITKHKKYGLYADIREIRDDLAKEILANYPLHRLFINEFSREYYISKKTMENQVAYAEKVLNNNLEKSNVKEQESQDSGNLGNRQITESESYTKLVTKQYVEAYQKTYKIGMGIKPKESLVEYINILVNKGLDEAESVTDLIEDCIKQALCFETIRKDANMKELTKDSLQEMHKKAVIIASQIEHKDFSYENRHKFEKAIKSAYEINQNLSKDKLLNEAEIGRLSEIIQTEKAQEIQKQHELQTQQSLQKSRGFDIEI